MGERKRLRTSLAGTIPPLLRPDRCTYALPMDDKEAQRVRDFQKAYEEEFGEKLTTSEASIRLHQLVQLYQLIARPLPPEPPGTSDTLRKG